MLGKIFQNSTVSYKLQDSRNKTSFGSLNFKFYLILALNVPKSQILRNNYNIQVTSDESKKISYLHFNF